MGARQINSGSASRTDRICKYNQLLRIQEGAGRFREIPGAEGVEQRMASTPQNPSVSSADGPYVAGTGLSFNRKYTPSCARWCTT